MKFRFWAAHRTYRHRTWIIEDSKTGLSLFRQNDIMYLLFMHYFVKYLCISHDNGYPWLVM